MASYRVACEWTVASIHLLIIPYTAVVASQYREYPCDARKTIKNVMPRDHHANHVRMIHWTSARLYG